jgi:hypothetical protein
MNLTIVSSLDTSAEVSCLSAWAVNMEQAASCIFSAAAVFGMHRKKSVVVYQIIPGCCFLLFFLFSTLFFIFLDACLLEVGNNECRLQILNVTITCFSLVYELVMCFQYVLSFYCGIFKCEEKLLISTQMEKLAQVLNCTDKIYTGKKKINTLFIIQAWPGTLVLIYLGLAGPFSYLTVYRNVKVWFGFFVIYIWQWKYVFFASVQGILFDELNNQIQVKFSIFNCI